MTELTSLNEIGVTPRDKLLYYKTILQNPYIKLKPYPRQAIPVIIAGKPELDGKVNSVLSGGPAYGGKTIVGSILAAQYLQEPDYTCLVTRLNYSELLDTNSIWENLIDWCCGDHLSEDIRCNFIKSPTPQIIAPNGNTIYFKAFDRPEKKQKFKSASYDRIVNDEASELHPDILKFEYRSMRNTSRIPRSIINLSNPGGPSTDYLVGEFIHGSKPYVALGWNHNPHIDQEAYKSTLQELDYIDQRYQMVGDWLYKPSQGDLINRDDMINQRIEYNTSNVAYSLVTIDLAGKGKDQFAVCRLDYLSNGLEVLVDFAQTRSPMPEDMLVNFLLKHNTNPSQPLTSLVVIEQEGGGSPLYAQRYFQDLLVDNGLNIPVELKTPKGNKYQRARPLMRLIKQGLCKLNTICGCLDDFIDESIGLMPVMTKSPNLVDSASLAHNYLQEHVLHTGSSIRMGVRI